MGKGALMSDISFSVVIPFPDIPGITFIMIVLGIFLLIWAWKLVTSLIVGG